MFCYSVINSININCKKNNRSETIIPYTIYREIKRTIDIMPAIHPNRRDQMATAVDATSASGRGADNAPSQKNPIKTEDIHKELNKLRVLYRPNERKINGSISWRELRRLTDIIEELTRQRVAPPASNQRMEKQLTRLERVANRLEKKSTIKEKKKTKSWVKKMSEGLANLSRSRADATPPTRNTCEEFEIKVYIKEDEEAKRIMAATTKNIVERAREVDVDKTLSTRKDIEAIKRRPELIVFRVKTENSKKILKENDF